MGMRHCAAAAAAGERLRQHTMIAVNALFGAALYITLGTNPQA
jgi:hypothetical protein